MRVIDHHIVSFADKTLVSSHNGQLRSCSIEIEKRYMQNLVASRLKRGTFRIHATGVVGVLQRNVCKVSIGKAQSSASSQGSDFLELLAFVLFLSGCGQYPFPECLGSIAAIKRLSTFIS